MEEGQATKCSEVLSGQNTQYQNIQYYKNSLKGGADSTLFFQRLLRTMQLCYLTFLMCFSLTCPFVCVISAALFLISGVKSHDAVFDLLKSQLGSDDASIRIQALLRLALFLKYNNLYKNI